MAKKTGPPSRNDFSEKRTRQVVLGQTVQHPATLLPAAGGLLGGLYFGLIASNPVLAGAALGFVALGGGTWAVNYFARRDSFAKSYHEKLHKMFEEFEREALAALRRDLRKVSCEEGDKQAENLHEKYDSCREVLIQKLDEGELAFSRYLGLAQEVLRAGMDNLSNVVSLLTSIRDVDIRDLQRSISELGNLPERTPAEDEKLKAMINREELFNNAMKESDQLLAQNEHALTALDHLTLEVSRIQTGQKSSLGMDDALAELERYAKRANRLSDRR